MATVVKTQVDVSILKSQMGIEVVDDGNGYLSAGDVLINRSASAVETHTVTAEELKTSAQVSTLLNQYTGGRAVVSFVFDSQKAKSFIASASSNSEGYLRMYEVTASEDAEIISDGTGVRYPTPQRTYEYEIGSGGLGGRGSGLGGGGTAEGLGGLGRSMPRYTYLATTPCDSKPTDPEKLACYKDKEAATARAEKLGELQEKIETAKEGIRTAVLNNSLTPAIIAEFTKLTAQFAAL